MNVIHRLWLGPRTIPSEYVWFGAEWRRLNPDWIVHDWTADDLPQLRNQAVVDHIRGRDAGRGSVEAAVQIADVAGYELVWRYGGVYVNVDIQPIRSLFRINDAGDLYTGIPGLPCLTNDWPAWATFEDDQHVVNCAIGGSARHPFWDQVIEALPGRYFADPDQEMNHTTGPRLLTDQWRRWRDRGLPGFVVLPAVTFNPVHWSTIPLGQDVADVDPARWPGTIGVHHWGHRKYRRTNHVGVTVP